MGKTGVEEEKRAKVCLEVSFCSGYAGVWTGVNVRQPSGLEV